MRWPMNRKYLLGFQAQGADSRPNKEALRYDGKPFEYWRDYMRTELKAERRIDAVRALAAFGVRGHAQSAATAIVDAIKDYGEDAYDGDAKDATPDQKLMQTAVEAIVKIGPPGFDIVLRKAKDGNVRRFAKEVYKHPFRDRRVNVLSTTAVRILLENLRVDDLEIRTFAGVLLGEAICDYPPSKDNVLTVLQAETDKARLVHSMIELLLDERKFDDYLVHLTKTFGSQGKAAAAALVKARLRGDSIDDGTFQAIGVEAKELIPDITEGLKDQKVEVRTRAAEWLAELGAEAKRASPALLQGLQDGPKKSRTSESPRSSLGTVTASWSSVKSSNEEENAWLAELAALRRMGAETRKLMPSLIRVVADCKRTCGCRIAVADALGEMGAAARDALPVLREAAKAPEAALREAAATAITKIEGTEQK
jgi:HEAT repeat protein